MAKEVVPYQPQEQSIQALLTTDEAMQMKAHGLDRGMLFGLVRAFIEALLKGLPSVVGAKPAGAKPAPGDVEV